MQWIDAPDLPAPHLAPLAVRGQPLRSLSDLVASQAHAARGPQGVAISAARLEGTLIEDNRIVSRSVVRCQQAGSVSTTTTLPDGDYSVRYDAGRAWASKPGQARPLPLTGAAARAVWREAQWPNLAQTLADFQARGHSIALLGLADKTGAAHYVLRLRLSDGSTRDYALDARTHRLRRARDVVTSGGARPVEVLWDDYRLVAGRLVPFGEEERCLADGRVLRTWQWRSVQLIPADGA